MSQKNNYIIEDAKDEEGFEVLKGKGKTGRSSKLSKEQKEEIKIVLIKSPQESGYYKCDGISLSDYIKNQYDIDICVRQCQRLFHEIGFSRIRPQTYPPLRSSRISATESKLFQLAIVIRVKNIYRKIGVILLRLFVVPFFYFNVS